MGNDLMIIKQIQEQIKTKLEETVLRKIFTPGINGYTVDEGGNVIGLILQNTKLSDISLLKGARVNVSGSILAMKPSVF